MICVVGRREASNSPTTIIDESGNHIEHLRRRDRIVARAGVGELRFELGALIGGGKAGIDEAHQRRRVGEVGGDVRRGWLLGIEVAEVANGQQAEDAEDEGQRGLPPALVAGEPQPHEGDGGHQHGENRKAEGDGFDGEEILAGDDVAAMQQHRNRGAAEAQGRQRDAPRSPTSRCG